MKLAVGTRYRVRDGGAFPGMPPGVPLLLAAVVPSPRGLEVLLSALGPAGRIELRVPVAVAEANLLPPPPSLESAAAAHCGFASWEQLLVALAAGQRFSIPLPVNGDTSVEAFARWHVLMQTHGLAMLPADGRALLARAERFSRAELDAAAQSMERFARHVAPVTPPWVKDGALDRGYFE